MQYAIFTKIGGELIPASKADYQDYYGFLKCPVCNEPVFLRKSHLRNGKEITASFVHHKAVPEISTCELRVGNYSKEDIEIFAAKARNQRLQKLNISMWKYLKTNMSVHFRGYNQVKDKTKGNPAFEFLLNYADECLMNNSDLIVDEFIPVLGKMLKTQDDDIGIIKRLVINPKRCDSATSSPMLGCSVGSPPAKLSFSAPASRNRKRRRLASFKVKAPSISGKVAKQNLQ